MKFQAQFYKINSQAVEQVIDYNCRSVKEAKGQSVSDAWFYGYGQIVLSRPATSVDWRTGEKKTYNRHVSYFNFGNGYWQDFK